MAEGRQRSGRNRLLLNADEASRFREREGQCPSGTETFRQTDDATSKARGDVLIFGDIDTIEYAGKARALELAAKTGVGELMKIDAQLHDVFAVDFFPYGIAP